VTVIVPPEADTYQERYIKPLFAEGCETQMTERPPRSVSAAALIEHYFTVELFRAVFSADPAASEFGQKWLIFGLVQLPVPCLRPTSEVS